jgi:hypothetical protein
MLTPEELRQIYEGAQVPEQIPDYVESVSGAEPFLHEGYLCYLRHSHLIFVGYPLREQQNTVNSYESACKRFRPVTVAIIAPRIWIEDSRLVESPIKDAYYRLDLPLVNLAPDVGYMVRRADRELRVVEGILGEEHVRLVNSFMIHREVSAGHQAIFKRIPEYLGSSSTAHLLEARRGDDLVAFDVLDLGSAHYGFYLFNFRSVKSHVPGASDLLFYEMVRLAHAAGKQALNLGLGINGGVRRFKEKWGAVPWLPYASAVVGRRSNRFLRALTTL